MRPTAALVLLALAACGDDGASSTAGGGSPPSCVPGSAQPCSCTDGRAGAQICRGDGAGFDACVCDPASTGSIAVGAGGSGAGGPGAGGSGAGGDVAATSTGQGGDPGTGGGGGTGGGCALGDTEPCYTGAPETLRVGPCVGGVRTCLPDGTFGACEGEVVPREEDCATPEDESCDTFTPPCPAPWSLWIATDWSLDPATVSAFDVAPDGSSIVAGYVNGTLVIQGASYDTVDAGSFVVGLSPTGAIEWTKVLSGVVVRAVAIAPDGTSVIGGMVFDAGDLGGAPVEANGGWDAFLAWLDGAGENVGQLVFGGVEDSNEGVDALDLGPGGEVVAAGTYLGDAVDLGGVALAATGSEADTFVATISPAQDVAWARTFPIDGVPAVAFDAAGGVALSQGSQAVDPSTVDLGSGPVAVRGFLARFDAAGELVAGRPFVGTGASRVGDGGVLSFLASGALYQSAVLDGGTIDVGSGALGSFPAYLLLETPDADLVTAYGYGAISSYAGVPDAISRRGAGAVLGGDLSALSTVSLGDVDLPAVDGVYVATLDGSATFLDAVPFACGSQCRIAGVGTDASGAILLAGQMFVATDFGSGTIPEGGQFGRGFVTRLDGPR